MGVTIHYRGHAPNYAAVEEIMNAAQMYAAQREWMFAMFDDPMGVMDDLDKDDPGYLEHEGPIRGIVIKPHPECEAVRLTFNVQHEVEGFTKTQFAPFEVHVEVIELLRQLAPYLEDFEVVDESGLWESGDVEAARAKHQELGAIISQLDEEDLRRISRKFGGVPDFRESGDEEGWSSAE